MTATSYVYPLSKLALSIRAVLALAHAGILTESQLRQFATVDGYLRGLPDVGAKTEAEIRDTLEAVDCVRRAAALCRQYDGPDERLDALIDEIRHFGEA